MAYDCIELIELKLNTSFTVEGHHCLVQAKEVFRVLAELLMYSATLYTLSVIVTFACMYI